MNDEFDCEHDQPGCNCANEMRAEGEKAATNRIVERIRLHADTETMPAADRLYTLAEAILQGEAQD